MELLPLLSATVSSTIFHWPRSKWICFPILHFRATVWPMLAKQASAFTAERLRERYRQGTLRATRISLISLMRISGLTTSLPFRKVLFSKATAINISKYTGNLPFRALPQILLSLPLLMMILTVTLSIQS